ncbi:uncharacterized protein LOC107306637 isoform X2 [Coturnix japonica]|uniref:uncharacterized protein LOC107306637 isoform X2 n=1 Tax=Coturnix japonica TaxID=93934 RepID=UPI00077788AC|nr:uncharacterized protein LOC107306637 isoform X2 [Coturnix japonica]
MGTRADDAGPERDGWGVNQRAPQWAQRGTPCHRPICRFKHTFQERGERRLRVGRGTLGCPPLHPPPGFMRLRRAAQPCPGAHVEPLLKTPNRPHPVPADRPWWRAAAGSNHALSTCKGAKCTTPHSHPVSNTTITQCKLWGEAFSTWQQMIEEMSHSSRLFIPRGVVPSGYGIAVLAEVQETDSHLWFPTKANCFWRSPHPNQLSPCVYFFGCSRENKIKFNIK